eukprot:gene14339-biopygen14780
MLFCAVISVSFANFNALGLIAGNQLCGVDFRGRGTYDASGIKALANALAFNTSLGTLNLLRNNLGDTGRAAILAVLERSDTLTSVCGISPNATEFDLSLNDLRLENVKLLAGELVFNGSLNTLNVRNTHITGKFARQLAEAVLAHPSMKVFNKIAMQDMRDDELTELDLSEQNVGVPGALVLSKLLVSNGSLSTLYLAGKNLHIFNLPIA